MQFVDEICKKQILFNKLTVQLAVNAKFLNYSMKQIRIRLPQKISYPVSSVETNRFYCTMVFFIAFQLEQNHKYVYIHI